MTDINGTSGNDVLVSGNDWDTLNGVTDDDAIIGGGRNDINGDGMTSLLWWNAIGLVDGWDRRSW